MNHTLYFLRYSEPSAEAPVGPCEESVEEKSVFGVKPYASQKQALYDAMTRRVSLTEDVGWNEAKLQKVLRKADFWQGFPLSDAVLVRAEFQPSSLAQRIDMLFLTATGELVPCELKIRGNEADSHGQLVRYVADLEQNPWDLEQVSAAHSKYLETINDETMSMLIAAKFAQFIEEHVAIPHSGPLSVRPGGFIIDVEFRATTQAAVRYLNEHQGMKIELVEVRTFVDNAWSADADERWMKIDFVTVLAPPTSNVGAASGTA